jgi:hypothetical protein
MKYYKNVYKLVGKKPVLCESLQDYKDAWELNRMIKKTEIDHKTVSTVFLPIDHNFGKSDQPVLFETVVFPECKICIRYNTYDEAIEGHNKVVNEIRLEQKRKLNSNKNKNN